MKICVPLLLVHLSCLSNCSEPRGLKDAVSPHRPLASSSCANADLFQQQLLHILTPLMLHLSCTFSWLFHEDLEMEKSAKKQFSLPINNMMFFIYFRSSFELHQIDLCYLWAMCQKPISKRNMYGPYDVYFSTYLIFVMSIYHIKSFSLCRSRPVYASFLRIFCIQACSNM